MSDAFFQAVITVNALILSVGGLFIVNAIHETTARRGSPQVTGWSRRSRTFLTWLFIGSLLLGILSIFVALIALIVSPVPVGPSIVVAAFGLTIAHLLLFALNAAGALGTLLRAGQGS
jgi:hypothetical protein